MCRKHQVGQWEKVVEVRSERRLRRSQRSAGSFQRETSVLWAHQQALPWLFVYLPRIRQETRQPISGSEVCDCMPRDNAYTAFNEESFEASHSRLDQRFQRSNISRNNATIEAHVYPALVFSSYHFFFQSGNSGRWGYSVKGHVDNRCHASKSGRLCASIEAFPFCSAGLIQMDVCVYEARKNDMWRMVHVRRPGRKG